MSPLAESGVLQDAGCQMTTSDGHVHVDNGWKHAKTSKRNFGPDITGTGISSNLPPPPVAYPGGVLRVLEHPPKAKECS